MDKHVQRILNLLAVADGNANANESRVARSIAERLMAKHRIRVYKENGRYLWKSQDQHDADLKTAAKKSRGERPKEASEKASRTEPKSQPKREPKQNQAKAKPKFKQKPSPSDIKFRGDKQKLDRKIEDLFRQTKGRQPLDQIRENNERDFPWLYVMAGMIVYNILAYF